MSDQNLLISVKRNEEYKYLSVTSMISVTFLICAMVFTYRIIEFGPFLTPGGVIPFAATYLVAALITEVYGYKHARKIIFGNFVCIFIFNITVSFLLKLPTPSGINYSAYNQIFNSALYVMIIYSIGFFFGDYINAFCIAKWRNFLKGKYFFIRLIGASIIGQCSFSIIVIPALYLHTLSPNRLIQQFCTTILAKLLVILILSFPFSVIAKLLMRYENIDSESPKVIFNPFTMNQT
ncbi:queuosine precursor transporter [Legionella dresdenensis]|uniref:Queuosine precursor transporter n=1 Tax=Legionella dresdenensis TaxID=450200 RepID=A0ABV8CEM0_9GAMM